MVVMDENVIIEELLIDPWPSVYTFVYIMVDLTTAMLAEFVNNRPNRHLPRNLFIKQH